VLISYQPDCGLDGGVRGNGPLENIAPKVTYVPDLDENGYYVPLGTLMLEANWEQSENINLLSLIRMAQDYIGTQAIGFDKVLLFGDILKRSISHQRSIDADSTSVAVTPSLSSTLGRDGLSGSLFGWGKSNGTSRPHSRRGAVFAVVAVMPGPWAGRKPSITQAAYFTNSIALPKELSDKPAFKQLQGLEKINELPSIKNYTIVPLQENSEATIELESKYTSLQTNK
jgi:hypothetical protein